MSWRFSRDIIFSCRGFITYPPQPPLTPMCDYYPKHTLIDNLCATFFRVKYFLINIPKIKLK